MHLFVGQKKNHQMKMENNWRNSHKGFKTFTNINAWRFIHYASVTFIYSIHTFQPHSQIHNEHTPTRKHRHTDLPSKVLYRKRRFNSVVKTQSPWFRASLFLTLFFFRRYIFWISYCEALVQILLRTITHEKKNYKCFTFAFAPLNEASNLCEISARNYR